MPKKPKPKPKSNPKAKPPRPARIGDNTLEGRAQPFVKRIENKLSDLESKRGAYMAACKPIHEDIREIYAEAKDKGIPVKALKGLIEYRRLEKKQVAIATDFADLDEKAAYDTLVETLGPLGFAAARAAGYTPKAEEDRDVRPRHMTQPDASATNGKDAPRADEAELARVGRGHDAPAADPPTADAATDAPQTAH